MTKQIAVIGAGIVGLSIAHAFAERGDKVTVFEKEPSAARHTSGHNSGIIHAGLYYKPESLKAKFCIEGRQKIYDFCTQHKIQAQKCGKLIVATHDAQMEKLRHVYNNAQAIGAREVQLLTAGELKKLEPFVNGIAAVLSPESGVFDVKAFVQALIDQITRNRGRIVYGAKIKNIRKENAQYLINGEGSFDAVINAAGLWAEETARTMEGLPKSSIPKTYFAKGNYFRLDVTTPFHHLVYPLPMPGGLGIHVSFDFNGTARFGPDVEWLDELPPEPDYTVDLAREGDFRAAIATYFPAINTMALKPDYAGIRPKLVGPGEPDADFIIQDGGELGLPGVVNLYGFESPGLTGCLAIADYISAKVKER